MYGRVGLSIGSANRPSHQPLARVIVRSHWASLVLHLHLCSFLLYLARLLVASCVDSKQKQKTKKRGKPLVRGSAITRNMVGAARKC